MPWDPAFTPNFHPDELACKCGRCDSLHDMQNDFMVKLQAIRAEFGPMTVTSGFRCPEHPVEKRKKRPGSHAQGTAADIAVTNTTRRYELIRLALKHGILGIGIATGFVHLDSGHKHAARPAAWKYS